MRVTGPIDRGGVTLAQHLAGARWPSPTRLPSRFALPTSWSQLHRRRVIHRVAEKALAAVQALALPHEASPLGHVSISVGIASAISHHSQNADALVAWADAALYRAKSAGRNRVESAS